MTLQPKQGKVTVRMYNTGFGDAFLLLFPKGARVLIDCGMHIAGPGPRPINEVVGSMIEDAGPKIDVLVCTHRHRDHISGFADPRWKEVEVGEVWMPWTEDPRDPEARRIRDRQTRLAEALTTALAGAGPDDPAAALALNSFTNADSMRALHEGFAGDPPRRFLPAGEDVVSDLECEALAAVGTKVKVLGPARDEAVIRDMDPPEGEAYLRAAAVEVAGKEPFAPFDDKWALSEDTLKGDPELSGLELATRDLRLIERAVEDDLFGAAVALEKAINGTSLVLSFECGDARLLFPADAQWGTWKRILDDEEASELVERVNLLKVGHHGSHNATPKKLVELLAGANRPGPLWAMVPTRPIKIWPEIPKTELLDALGQVTPRIARSDAGEEAPAPGFDHWSKEVIEARIPT